jgi:hypothetical protein
MNDERGLQTGHLLALGGAALALAALWAPWYEIRLDGLQGALAQPGVAGTQVGNLLQSVTALLPKTISGDAWETLGRVDVLVALLAALSIAVLLAAAGAFGSGISVARDAAARACAGTGAIAALAVGARALDPPAPSAYVDVRWGAWACLIGCALMVAGGLLALRPGRASIVVAGKETGGGQCASTAAASSTPPGATRRPA